MESEEYLVKAMWEARDLVLRLRGVAKIYRKNRKIYGDEKGEKFIGYGDRMERIMLRTGKEIIDSLSKTLDEMKSPLDESMENFKAIESYIKQQRRRK